MGDVTANQGKKVPLRNFSMQSYGVENGRSVSSLQGAGNMGNHATGKGTQIPSIKGLDRSGSADSGRRKMGGSSV